LSSSQPPRRIHLVDDFTKPTDYPLAARIDGEMGDVPSFRGRVFFPL